MPLRLPAQLAADATARLVQSVQGDLQLARSQQALQQRRMDQQFESLMTSAKLLARTNPAKAAKLFSQGFQAIGQPIEIRQEDLDAGFAAVERIGELIESGEQEQAAFELKIFREAGLFQTSPTIAKSAEQEAQIAGGQRRRRREALMQGLNSFLTEQPIADEPPEVIQGRRQAVEGVNARLQEQLAQIDSDLSDPLVASGAKETLRQRKAALLQQIPIMASEQNTLAVHETRNQVRDSLSGLSNEALEKLVIQRLEAMTPSFEQAVALRFGELVAAGKTQEAEKLIPVLSKQKEAMELLGRKQLQKAQVIEQDMKGIMTVLREGAEDVRLRQESVQRADEAITEAGTLTQRELGPNEQVDLNTHLQGMQARRAAYDETVQRETQATGQILQTLTQQITALEQQQTRTPREQRRLDGLQKAKQYVQSVTELIAFNPHQDALQQIEKDRLEGQIARLDANDPEEAGHIAIAKNQLQGVESFGELRRRDRQTAIKNFLTRTRDLQSQLKLMDQDRTQLLSGITSNQAFLEAQSFLTTQIQAGENPNLVLNQARKKFPSAFEERENKNALEATAKLARETRDNPWDALSEPFRNALREAGMDRDRFVRLSPEERREVKKLVAQKLAQGQPMDFGDERELLAKSMFGKPVAELTQKQAQKLDASLEARRAQRSVRLTIGPPTAVKTRAFEALDAAQDAQRLIEEIRVTVREDPTATGLSGSVQRILGGFIEQMQAAVGQDPEVGRLFNTRPANVTETLTEILSFKIALSLNPASRISDPDVQAARRIVGTLDLSGGPAQLLDKLEVIESLARANEARARQRIGLPRVPGGEDLSGKTTEELLDMLRTP